MAYTKAPVSDTHNVVRIPTLGTPIVVTEDSVTTPTVVTLSYIDCFPKHENQWGKDAVKRVHKRQPWARYTASPTIVSGAICRQVVLCEGSSNPYIYFGRGANFYRMDISAPSSPVITSVVAGITGMSSASGTLAVSAGTTNKVCFLTLSNNLYTWNEDATGVTTTSLAGIGVSGYRNLVYMNGYLFAANSDGRIYNSGPGGALTTWNSTDYIVPEIYPDHCRWLDVYKNHLVAFSANSVEFFTDGAIELGSPMVRQETYASRVGILDTGDTRMTARINDDIYFLGRNYNNVRGLYRIRDFKVEEIENVYVSNVLNWVGTTVLANSPLGVDTIIMNGEPQILISTSAGYDLVYNPSEDCWWSMRTAGDSYKGLTDVNTDFPGWYSRIGGNVYPTYQSYITQPFQIALGTDFGTTVYLYHPAYEGTHPSITSDLYTEVIDFGINYYKHIARVDAVGDYGANTLTLSYNKTPNYSQTYTACAPTRTPSTAGYANNASWYNLGGYRRISFKLTMTGTSLAMHDGFDIEYNAGAT